MVYYDWETGKNVSGKAPELLASQGWPWEEKKEEGKGPLDKITVILWLLIFLAVLALFMG